MLCWPWKLPPRHARYITTMSRLTKKYLSWAAVALACVVAALVLGAIVLDIESGFPWVTLTVGAVAAACAFLVLWAAFRRFAAPLESLTSALESAATGDFSAETGRPDDGMDHLFGAFESARAEMRESVRARDYFDRLVSNISDAIVVADADGRISRANLAAASLLGYEDGPPGWQDDYRQWRQPEALVL